MSSRRCAAKTCYNTQGCRPNLKFFNFPKDEETCMKWIINSEREDLLDKPVEQVAKFLLCADHFESHWFLNPKYKTIFIRTGNPVPTIFYNNLADFIPKGLQKNYERKKRNHTEQRNGFGSHVPESSEQPSTEELLEILGDGDTCNTSQTQPVDPDDYTVEINIDLDPCIDDSSANGAYHRMCRLCARLVYEFKLTSIFSSEDSQNLANKINRILPEKIYAGDGLPQHVCKTCIGILNECEAAVQAFIAADRKLRSLFNLQSVLLNQEQVEEMKSRNESPNSPLSTGENAGLPSGLEEFLTVRDDSQSKMAEDDPLETSQKSPVNVITTVCQKSEHDSFLRVYTYEKSGDQFSVVNESNNTSGNVTVKNSASEDISGNSEFDSENPENSDSSTVMELPVNPEAVVKIEQTWTENPEITTETCDSSQEAKCYYCSICGEMFNERNKLLIHEITEHIFEEKDEKESSSMQKKHKREQTTCSECGETFSGKKPLQRHIKQQHIPAENICEYCGAHYQSKSHLESHRVLHTKEKLFRCEVCEENFQFKKDLLLHKRSKHSRNKSLNCTVCSKTCPNRNALWRHEKTHTDERTVLCYLCGKVLSNPQSMRVHMRTHSADRPYSCPKCGKSFKDNASVSKHMLVHSADKNFSCEVCGRAFYSKALVKQHSLSHSGVKPHRCDVCGAAYNRLGNLNQHKKKHVENPQKVESFEHECIVCGKRMRSDLTLKYHLAKHTGEKKPFDCQICGKRFVAVDPYRVHMRIHTGERPYQCTTCGKTFRSSFTLKQHSGLHRDECPYACPYCERKFKRLQSLIVHKRTHTGEKPHRCPLCGRAFAQKGDMLKHTRTHNRYKSNVSASKMKEQAGVILEIEHIAGITELALSDSEITSEYLIDMPIVEVETEIPSEMQGNIPTEITSEVT